MFNSHSHRSFLCLKGITFAATTSPPPKSYFLFQHHPLPLSLHFCTSTSHPRPFAVSYLINTFGFSPEYALEASKELRFKTSEKPDSVLKFFRNRGFSKSQLHDMIQKAPWLLSCDPEKRVLPKFEFLLSKGASTSDVAFMVTKNPEFLRPGLETRIIPTYELVHRFLQSDKDTIAFIIRNNIYFSKNRVTPNVKLLIDYGVTGSSIARLLGTRPSVLWSNDLVKRVEEVKELGFNPSKLTFSIALLAKCAVSKSRWDEKVDAFKKWGWSDETILQAFRRHPHCMLTSSDKINALMSFWVNQLGWDALALVKGPILFGFSLEKRIIPRAAVIQYLLAKDLMNKNACLIKPFKMSENVFLKKFVKCFKEEDRSQLLKLYQEKMNLNR